MEPAFIVADQGTRIPITRELLLGTAGASQAITTALAFRLFSMALDDLSPGVPPERSNISVLTALPGQGFVDCVTFVIKPQHPPLGRLAIEPEAGPTKAPASVAGRFYFEFAMADRRRGYWPLAGLFDAAFREKVNRFQDADCTPEEAAAYQAYKEGLAGRILEEPREALFCHRDVAQTQSAATKESP